MSKKLCDEVYTELSQFMQKGLLEVVCKAIKDSLPKGCKFFIAIISDNKDDHAAFGGSVTKECAPHILRELADAYDEDAASRLN